MVWSCLRRHGGLLIHFLFRADGGQTQTGGVTPVNISGAALLYFWIGPFNDFPIDPDPDQSLAVAGLLAHCWIYSASRPEPAAPDCFLSLSETERVCQ